MILYILLASLLLVGCQHKPLQVIETDESIEEKVFDVCFPPRGEEVKFHLRSNGHAFNSTPYDCT